MYESLLGGMMLLHRAGLFVAFLFFLLGWQASRQARRPLPGPLLQLHKAPSDGLPSVGCGPLQSSCGCVGVIQLIPCAEACTQQQCVAQAPVVCPECLAIAWRASAFVVRLCWPGSSTAAIRCRCCWLLGGRPGCWLVLTLGLLPLACVGSCLCVEGICWLVGLGHVCLGLSSTRVTRRPLI